MAQRRGVATVGTSGYQYDHWKGVFYPEGLPKTRWFGYYAERFDTVEINNTFYRLPPRAVFERWRAAAPAGFCFAVKYSRFGSHRKRLKDPEQTVERFLGSAEGLGSALGPILVQLPPRWHADPGRLEAFLEAVGRRHRWAVEFRDDSWLCEDVYRVLESHGAALCVHDLLPDHPRRLTAGFAYFRFHGVGYGGNYTAPRLAEKADALRKLMDEGMDVYAYFNNDLGGYAVRNAVELREALEAEAGARRSRREGG
ncbi:MAG: DUF72 domain-containing protein [Deltaproteobacteria bacterium]|nr:DUF72 domain-containing protein [Deltaproteobacteria bacterium]